MQKLHADEISKQKAELEAARKDREKIETNNRFLEHDLAQEAARARRALKDGTIAKPKPHGRVIPVVTPKKTRTLPFRDGFDDDDVVMVSPPRAQEKTRVPTPKAGSKRKRHNAEQREQSPVRKLPLDEPVEPVKTPETLPPEQPATSGIDVALLARLDEEDDRFQVWAQSLVSNGPFG